MAEEKIRKLGIAGSVPQTQKRAQSRRVHEKKIAVNPNAECFWSTSDTSDHEDTEDIEELKI